MQEDTSMWNHLLLFPFHNSLPKENIKIPIQNQSVFHYVTCECTQIVIEYNDHILPPLHICNGEKHFLKQAMERILLSSPVLTSHSSSLYIPLEGPANLCDISGAHASIFAQYHIFSLF